MPAMLVDASGFIYRAFYAMPPMTRADGFPTGAVHGFCTMLWRLKKKHAQATHFGVVFDKGKSAARTARYPDYKAKRPPQPDDLQKQLSVVRAATRAFGMPVVESDGVEADDLLASYAEAFRANGDDVIIVSPDKDVIQLIRTGVGILCPIKDARVGLADSLAKFGVPPRLAADAQGLIGDSSDNIPGVPGIGPKKAGALLEQFGSLEAVLANADMVQQKGMRAALKAYADQARLSHELATLDSAVPLPVSLKALEARDVEAVALLEFARSMEFTSFAADVAAFYSLGTPA